MTVVGCAERRALHVPLPEDVGFSEIKNFSDSRSSSTKSSYASIPKPESESVEGIFLRVNFTDDAEVPQTIRASVNQAYGFAPEELVNAILAKLPDWLPLKNEQIKPDGLEVVRLTSGSNRIGMSKLLQWTWTNESTDTDMVLQFEFKLKQ